MNEYGRIHKDGSRSGGQPPRPQPTAERRLTMEWQPVLSPHHNGYAPGFDRDALLQFRRELSNEIHTFRMCDQPPYFNIAGLYWRLPPPPE